MPAAVRAWVERVLGSTVVSAATQQGGFSPGVAARLVTASGRRAFVKTVGTALNEKTPSLFRQEIEAVEAIGTLPSAPRLLDVYDDGDWVGLLFEDIEGRLPSHPWIQSEADRVLAALDELTDALDPSPWPDAPVVAVRSRDFLSRWPVIIADGLAVPDWLEGRVEELAELSRAALEVMASGKALAHYDLRADNIILTDDRVVFIDWAHPGLGPRWTDTVILQADMRDSPIRLPALPDDPAITGFVAAIAGGQWWGAAQEAPPGLPTIRAWQREQALVHLDWVRERLG
ncbi:phosphotransferase [Kribbella antibiotica]|uniref:phosphotransferase n=1 Tax=Kribbella antibiotica TaxID=190195 RepID=UPI001404EB69|nr:phosphotransferase [Kribbella antibiotica]